MKPLEKSQLYYLSENEDAIDTMNPAYGVMKKSGLKYDETQFLPVYATLSSDGIDALQKFSLLSREPKQNGRLH